MIRFLRTWRHRGFVGPRYEGLRGRLRFVYHELVIRTDIVFVARADLPRRRIENPTDLELRWIRTWDECAPLTPFVDAEYGKGYTAGWRRVFEWGEVLALAMMDGQIAGFVWVQSGSPSGARCPFTLLWEDDRNLVRAGVMPSMRGRGVNTRLYALVLDDLFSQGVRRVFGHCATDNLPSLRALLRNGFQPVGALRVLGAAFGGGVAWRPILPGDIPQVV